MSFSAYIAALAVSDTIVLLNGEYSISFQSSNIEILRYQDLKQWNIEVLDNSKFQNGFPMTSVDTVVNIVKILSLKSA